LNACVVDASVAVKWFCLEEHSARARRMTGWGIALHAPERLGVEVDSALWKRVHRGEMSLREAEDARALFASMAIEIHAIGALRNPAFRLAARTGQSVYDCLYLALAEGLALPLVTADQRFLQAVAPVASKGRLVWIGDVAEPGSPRARREGRRFRRP